MLTYARLPLFSAQATYLLRRAKTAVVYNDLQLKNNRDWQSVEETIRLLVQLVFRVEATEQDDVTQKKAERATITKRVR